MRTTTERRQEIIDILCKRRYETIEDSTKKYAKQKRVFSLISTNFVQTFKKEVEKIPDSNTLEHIYYRLRLVIDYISGMTDSYAKEIYQTLKGQEM